MRIIKFGLIGSGWRGEFYIRIAKQLPEMFKITSMYVRDYKKGKKISDKFDIRVVNSIDEFMEDTFDYVVLATKRGFVLELLEELFKRNIAVLCETPPGESLKELNKVWQCCQKYNARLQVAEQYIFQPLYSAWYKGIQDGLIGNVDNINISSLHGYHGVSIIRKFLGINYENCTVYGKQFNFNVTETYGREGMIFNGEIVKTSRKRLTLEFENGKIAFFDFTDPTQYHSFIRTRQLTVQGVRGEIDDLTIRYLNNANLPLTQELNRIDLGKYGNQNWTHYGIMLGDKFLYKSPFTNVRFNDDEIAVASCMEMMGDYLQTGKEFYPISEALQDMYISLIMDEALIMPNKEIKTVKMPWSNK